MSFRIGGTFVDFQRARAASRAHSRRARRSARRRGNGRLVARARHDRRRLRLSVRDRHLRIDGRDDTQEPARAQISRRVAELLRDDADSVGGGRPLREVPANTPHASRVMVNSAFATRYFPARRPWARLPAQPRHHGADRGRGRERARVRARSRGRAHVLSVPHRVRDAGARVPRACARRPGGAIVSGPRQDQGARAAARGLRRRAAAGAYRRRVRGRSAAHVGARVVRGHGARARVPRRLRHAELRRRACAAARSACASRSARSSATSSCSSSRRRCASWLSRASSASWRRWRLRGSFPACCSAYRRRPVHARRRRRARRDVAVLAALLPAWRAARVEPMRVLREE